MTEDTEQDIDHEDYEQFCISRKKSKLKDKNAFDDFLREIHGTTAVGMRNAMPTVETLRMLFKTKSARIRYLHDMGFKPPDISRHLGLIPQHIHNVLTYKHKKAPREEINKDKEGSSDNGSSTIL